MAPAEDEKKKTHIRRILESKVNALVEIIWILCWLVCLVIGGEVVLWASYWIIPAGLAD